MGRIRTIKPQMFTDEDIGDLSFEARWLFAGLFTQADREGRLEDRPRKLKVELMAYDSVNVEYLLRELAEARFITRYEAEGKRYIHIRTFWKHQHFHIKEPPSTLPEPPAPCENGASTVQEPVPPGRRGREGVGREGKEKLEASAASTVQEPASASAVSNLFPDEYLDELQADPAYGEIKVRHVCAKMRRWCKEHGQEPTRDRLINWLNREEPRKGNGANDDDRGTSAQAKRVAASLERDN